VGDLETPADQLIVSGSSSNQGLVRDENIVFGGSGSNRTVTLLPVTNAFGTSVITLSVTDTDFTRTNITFLLTVNSVNDLPSISSFANQTIDEDTTTGIISF